MLRRVVEANSQTYLFSPDDSSPLGARMQAIVKLRVIDEITRRAPDSNIVIETPERRLSARVASDGICGFVGIPQQVFPALRTAPDSVEFTISADRYVPLTQTVNFPLQGNFPDDFTPSPTLELVLHRQPTVITGRTVQLNSGTPLSGAIVSLFSIRRRPPDPNISAAPDPPDIVALRPPLASGRPALTTLIQQRDLISAATPAKHLVQDVLAGANPILLSDRVGLNTGEVLLIDAGEPDLAEFIAINTVSVVNPPDQQALITLEYPLVNAHRRNAGVRLMTPQAPGLPQHFAVEAIEGDTCVFLDGVTTLASAQQVQITGPGTPDEFHQLRRFSTISDADGYYRLPPLSRVAQVQIHAEKIVGPDTFQALETFSPDYRLPENRLDLRLKV